MTYLAFLVQFVLVPMAILAVVAMADASNGRRLPQTLRTWPAGSIILLHCVIALAYTTPWDNYLIYAGVWMYEKGRLIYDHWPWLQLYEGGRVRGRIGYVPIEEYAFFLLQPILCGLWLLFLAKRLPMPIRPPPLAQHLRWQSCAAVGVVWLAGLFLLLSRWEPGTYLALQLVWALPPIMIQLAFGADILWRYRTLVVTAIVSMGLYLSLADALAIGAGTWTINPEKSIAALKIAGLMPIEEVLFFFLTCILCTFGIVLALTEESQPRLPPYFRRWLSTITGEEVEPKKRQGLGG